jgi:predicted XRE-type DNA-binding protein
MKVKDDDMELIRGSGNVFADFGDPDAETKLLKAQMAADIINTLNERGLSVRAGAKVAQVDPADIQRIRNADLSRFTIDRLVRIAYRLGRKPEMKMTNVRVGAVA